jgi:hypothetical protein
MHLYGSTNLFVTKEPMATMLVSSGKVIPFTAIILWLCSSTAASFLASVDQAFDYVIVGGGPGGLVMANRLSEDPNVFVAVVEGGTWPEDVVGNLTEVPAFNGVFDVLAANATFSPIDWGFITTPQEVGYCSLPNIQNLCR